MTLKMPEARLVLEKSQVTSSRAQSRNVIRTRTASTHALMYCTTCDMWVYFLYYVTRLGITQERIELNYDIYTTST